MSDVTRYGTPERYMQRGVHARANISPSRPRSVEIYVALLILLPALVALHRIWAIQAALILLVLSLPGLLLTSSAADSWPRRGKLSYSCSMRLYSRAALYRARSGSRWPTGRSELTAKNRTGSRQY